MTRRRVSILIAAAVGAAGLGVGLAAAVSSGGTPALPATAIPEHHHDHLLAGARPVRAASAIPWSAVIPQGGSAIGPTTR